MSLVNVIKAGGTSVGTPREMRTLRDEVLRQHRALLRQDSGATTYLIVSGTGKQKGRPITEKNTELSIAISQGKDVEANTMEMWEREQRVVSYFGLPKNFNRQNFKELEYLVRRTSMPADERFARIVTCVGERLKPRHFEAIFNQMQQGVAVYVPPEMVGYATTERLSNAKLTPDGYGDISSRLASGKYSGKIVVMGGFMGTDKDTNRLSVLERGGSDTHAVNIGVGVGAQRVIIFSDTPLREADPRYAPDARVVPMVNNAELGEFIGYGSEIVADRANEAARVQSIELVLRDIFSLKDQTIVSANPDANGIKGIGARNAVIMSLGNIPDIPGALHTAYGIIKSHNLGVINEAGDRSTSSMVLVGSPEYSIEDNASKIGGELRAMGFSVNQYWSQTRVGVIGRGIGDNLKAFDAIHYTLRKLHLPPNAV